MRSNLNFHTTSRQKPATNTTEAGSRFSSAFSPTLKMQEIGTSEINRAYTNENTAATILLN